jgi:3-phenylpropionate/trans-cinnamate dioxygenase ferredoxin reductase component
VSEPYGLLVIGGGPAGLAAVRGYRGADGDGPVAIVSDEALLPYNRPPLTKDLLRGDSEIADLPMEEEAWFEENRVNLIASRAVALDADARTVTLSGGRVLGYRSCLLATGGEPKRLPIPGSDHPRVAVMRSLEDLRRLLDRLGRASRVAVIGSGFIACEIASSLRRRRNPVELISDETLPNAARLGDVVAEAIAGWLRDDGVTLHMGHPVEAIEHGSGCARVIAGERQVEAEVVVMGFGIAPRTELAISAGFDLDAGAIPVDSHMRTEGPGVLAAGDVARAHNAAAGRALHVEHWGDALAQGGVAGRTAAGEDGEDNVWRTVPGFWSTIGAHTIKYVAWGDGYDSVDFTGHPDGPFSARYGSAGKLVGVLTHDVDDEYQAAQAAVTAGVPWRS